MAQDAIAIICDCDGTLCPDTTASLIRSLGLDARDYWRDVAAMVEGGWDPPLAYLNKLLEPARSGRGEPPTLKALAAVGSAVQFYPGALTFVERLRDMLRDNSEFRDAGLTIDWYIVSSGLEALLMATPLGTLASDVFGCAFEYDAEGRAVAVRRSVTFTEKTKFLFAINKGITGDELRRNPYRVNDAVRPDNRRVPFEHMIYIGDGPSDIPCFSMVKNYGGHVIGVIPSEDPEGAKPYELARGERLTVGPYDTDYSDGTTLYRMLWRCVQGIANNLIEKRAHTVRRAPTH